MKKILAIQDGGINGNTAQLVNYFVKDVGGISDPRNKSLMKMLNLLGIGERAGSGVPGIYSVWESQGWIAPQVIEEYEPDRTILKLAFINAK